MNHLVLTLDYEIFGNGAGDVRRDVVEPTGRLLDICDNHGARMTIMFEVGEYWAFERYDDQLRQDLGYSPCGVMKAQITEAVQRGHDVQLHLHPWWIGASLRDGNWQLKPQYKRITDLPNGMGSESDLFSVFGALHEGKRTLETLIHPVRAEYECLVYRTAMFWGQPSRDLIAGLRRAGLIADSSVIPGLQETLPVPTDYRGVPSAAGYWWTCADDIARPGPRGEQIVEFPVYSRLRPYIWNLKWTKLSATLKRRSVERANAHGYGMMEARKSTDSLGQVLRKLAALQPFKYDFCKLSARDMIRGLYQAIRDDQAVGDDVGTPVVMLGHSKDFWNDRNLTQFLGFVRTECEGQVSFGALGELTKAIVKRDVRRGATGSESGGMTRALSARHDRYGNSGKWTNSRSN